MTILYATKQQAGINMASKMIFNKTSRGKEFERIAVHAETKAKFDNLVDKLNCENRKINGSKAAKITRNDVLNELLDAYLKVGV